MVQTASLLWNLGVVGVLSYIRCVISSLLILRRGTWFVPLINLSSSCLNTDPLIKYNRKYTLLFIYRKLSSRSLTSTLTTRLVELGSSVILRWSSLYKKGFLDVVVRYTLIGAADKTKIKEVVMHIIVIFWMSTWLSCQLLSLSSGFTQTINQNAVACDNTTKW